MSHKSLKIFHLADVHWRGLSRHEEYREVFNKFFDICRRKSPDMIVVGGDIVHSKTQGISPELIENLNWWFTSLAEIAPTHVILGNHDGLILNKSRQDAISPILSALNNPRISLYKKSGTFDSSHPGVKFCVFSCFDEEGWKDVSPAPGFINIALFHGAVRGALTDSDWEVGHEIDVDFFRSYDFAMLGDIHKVQFLDADKRIAYPGSTIQQNYGEAPEKGFLMWDIKSRDRFDVEFIQIVNDRPFITIDWAGSVQKTYEAARSFSPTSRFRVRFTESISNSDVSGIQDKLKSDLKPTEVMIKDETKRDNTLLFSGDKKIERKSIRDISTMRTFLSDYLDSVKVKTTEEKLSQMATLFESYFSRSTEGEEIVRDTLWEIKRIQFNNTFAYGEGNEINFDSLSGITGIFGKNRRGKSSIIGTMMYALFNATDRGPMKNLHVINNSLDYCDAKVDLVVNGEDYSAHRCTTRVKPKKGSEYATTYLNFSKGDEKDLSDEQRRETEKVLRNMIGSSEDFLMTTLASQGQINSFIGEKATARKSILSKFLDLDIFEKMSDLVKEDLSPLKAQTKNKSIEEIVKEIDRIESSLSSSNSSMLQVEKEHQDIQDYLDSILKISSGNNASSERSETIRERIDLTKRNVDHLSQEILTTSAERDQANSKLLKAQGIRDAFSLDEINKKVAAQKEIEKSLSALRSDLRSQQIILDTKTKSVAKLNDVPCGDSFPTCKFIRDSHEDKKTLAENQALLTKILGKVSDLETKMREAQDENPEEMLRKYNKVLEMIKGFEGEINVKDLMISHKQVKVKDLSAAIVRDQSLLNSTLEQESKIDPDFARQLAEVESSRTTLRNLTAKRLQLATQIGKDTAQIEMLRKQQEELRVAIEKFETLNSLLGALSKKGIPLMILNSQLPTINAEISSILQGVVDFTVELEADLDSNSMDIFLNYGDNKRVIELASGMEKMISSLAIRVALTNISSLPKTSMLIIDEGFGVLDDTNIDACTKLLESFKKWFKNIIVISHVDAIKDAVDNVIEITWENGNARVNHA
jgi:DNA repair exonuclease SbcCD ATPase subunit/DNA repair exonuclease SbcCD nuclease subunit